MKKFLFLGNSHTYFNDMPELFVRLYRAGTGEDAEAVMLSHPGRTWEWHEKEAYELRYNLLYGHYDWCFLQQAAHPFPGEKTTRECGKYLLDLCRVVDTQPVLVETWARKTEPQNQEEMNRVYRSMSAEYRCALSPVGEIWQTVRKNCPELELYFEDGAHASVYGDYLIACCHYRTVTGNSVQMLPEYGIDFSRFRAAADRNEITVSAVGAEETALDAGFCREIKRAVDAGIAGTAENGR